MLEGIILDQAEFIEMGSPSRDSAFSVITQGGGKSLNSFVG